MKADKRYYVNADRSKVVDEGDPEAAYLLASVGDDISNEDVRRYGLGKKKDDEPKAEQAPETESKMVPEPPANKARQMPASGGEKK